MLRAGGGNPGPRHDMSSIDEQPPPATPARRRVNRAPAARAVADVAAPPAPAAAVPDSPPASFALRAGEPVGRGLTRVAGDQLDAATRRLRGDAGVTAKDVHESRKALKRVRALARLLRPALGEDAYRHENAALRDAARHLAGARDAEVMAATLEGLAPESPEAIDTGDDFAALRAHLHAERERIGAQLHADAGPARQAAAELDAVHGRAATWVDPDAGFEIIEPGLRQIYREARQRHRRARRRPTSEHLHEWRKRVKDLRYCAELLEPIDPEGLATMSARADRLGEMLGDDHDLAVLAAYADAHHELFATPAERKRLRRLVRRQRSRLRRRALKLGDELLALRPRRFTARLATAAAAMPVAPTEPQ